MKNNSEIEEILRRNREITKFAKFVKVTPQGLYGILRNNKPTRSVYWQWIEFLQKQSEEKGLKK